MRKPKSQSNGRRHGHRTANAAIPNRLVEHFAMDSGVWVSAVPAAADKCVLFTLKPVGASAMRRENSNACHPVENRHRDRPDRMPVEGGGTAGQISSNSSDHASQRARTSH